jgi:hypothetical protein
MMSRDAKQILAFILKIVGSNAKAFTLFKILGTNGSQVT